MVQLTQAIQEISISTQQSGSNLKPHSQSTIHFTLFFFHWKHIQVFKSCDRWPVPLLLRQPWVFHILKRWVYVHLFSIVGRILDVSSLKAQDSLISSTAFCAEYFLPYFLIHSLIQPMVKHVWTLSQTHGQVLGTQHEPKTSSSCWHSLLEVRGVSQGEWDTVKL